jgi:CRP-like cAMP-binding protein
MGTLPDHTLQVLTGCPLFRGVDPEVVSGLLSGIPYQVRSYEKGDLIARAGDEVFFQHVVLQGSVKGEMMDFAGKVIKIEDIHPPRPLATAFLFGNRNRYPVNIVANEQVEILSIPRDAFLKLMQKHELVLRNFVNSISSRGQFLSSKIKFLSFTTIKGKLAQYLLDLAENMGSEQVTLPLSQSELSELFGVARPSVGRAVSEMNRDGIIRSDGRQVTLLDRERLSQLLK